MKKKYLIGIIIFILCLTSCTENTYDYIFYVNYIDNDSDTIRLNNIRTDYPNDIRLINYDGTQNIIMFKGLSNKYVVASYVKSFKYDVTYNCSYNYFKGGYFNKYEK